jgi:hypothetical protein
VDFLHSKQLSRLKMTRQCSSISGNMLKSNQGTVG